MAIPDLSEALIREHAAPESFDRGLDYLRHAAVGSLVQRGNVLEAEVEGSAPTPYRVRVIADAGGITKVTCTCPYASGGWCKHVVAILLAALRHPEEIAKRPPLEAVLALLDPQQLRDIVLHLVEREPRLVDIVEGQVALLTAAPATAAAAASSAPRRSPVDVGAFRRQVRSIFRGLGGRYASEAYGQTDGVTHEVRTVLEQALAFVHAGDGHSALAILEAITEEYRDGYELLDDSDGEGGELFRDIGLAWAEAVLSADVAASERQGWGEKLAAWERELADYGVEEGFATALAAATELGERNSASTSGALPTSQGAYSSVPTAVLAAPGQSAGPAAGGRGRWPGPSAASGPPTRSARRGSRGSAAPSSSSAARRSANRSPTARPAPPTPPGASDRGE